MKQGISLKGVLFLDIETVSGEKHFDLLSEEMQQYWANKAKQLQRSLPEEERKEAADYYPQAAAIYAEFGKIICISVGYFVPDKDSDLTLRIKSFASSDEAELLNDFADLMNQHFNEPDKNWVCGHNIKEFDMPYICRRMVIQGIPLPNLLDVAGKKPWEVRFIDTMEHWKFGDYKSFTSLKLLCTILGIPTPKDDIDGSDVGRVFWEENDLDRIATYCRKDVIATAQVFRRFRNEALLPADKIVFV